MSLILEALKKSETRRRLGEAPDLGTPFTVSRRRRNPLPLIVILIVVAAGFGWWYLRTPALAPNTVVSLPSPPAPPARGSNPANAQQLAKAATTTPPMTAAPTRDSPATPTPPKTDVVAPAMTARPPAARTDAAAVAPAAAAGKTSDLQTTRAMNQHLPVPAAPAPATANPNRAPATATAMPPPVTRATTPAAPPAAPAPARQPSAQATAPAPATRPPVLVPAPAAAPATPTTGASIAAPAPADNVKASADTALARPADAPASLPVYYELAYGVRKDIPPFALSMHVFAADAAGRFVVVDGERKAEGDAIKEGLTLREIRPDGMVLEFRGQRFFYPRPGR